jgi:hypothetical protein
MPQPEPAQRIVDRREPGLHPAAALQLGLEVSQREVGRRLDQTAQVGCVRLEHASPVAAVTRWRGAAGGADPLHELDGGRRADREAPRRLTDRAALLDRTYDAQPQVHGHRCRHDDIPVVSTVIVESRALIPRNRNML